MLYAGKTKASSSVGCLEGWFVSQLKTILTELVCSFAFKYTMYTQLTNILEVESEIRRKSNMLNNRIMIELERLEKLIQFTAFKNIR